MKKEKTILVFSLALLMVISIGKYTYSYFSARITENNKTQTIIKSNTLGLIYTGVTDINVQDIIPGDYMTKTFTVENTSNREVNYNIYMENITNEFNEDLVYTVSDQNGVVIEETVLPTTKTGKKYIKKSLKIATGDTKTYTLTIKFKYNELVDQNAMQGAAFNATLGVDTEYGLNSWKFINDVNSNRIADIGDEIAIDNEHFYVISNQDGIIHALSKYNLNVGDNANPNATYGIQDASVRGEVNSGTTYGTVAFSDNYGWPYKGDVDINIRDYDGPVKTALYDENTGYENYIKETIENATVRLITMSDLKKLGCDFGSYTCKDTPAWVRYTSFWIGTSHGIGATLPRMMRNTAYTDRANYYKGDEFGVRPVVIIPAQ